MTGMAGSVLQGEVQIQQPGAGAARLWQKTRTHPPASYRFKNVGSAFFPNTRSQAPEEPPLAWPSSKAGKAHIHARLRLQPVRQSVAKKLLGDIDRGVFQRLNQSSVRKNFRIGYAGRHWVMSARTGSVSGRGQAEPTKPFYGLPVQAARVNCNDLMVKKRVMPLGTTLCRSQAETAQKNLSERK
jgi:hypothetical protein